MHINFRKYFLILGCVYATESNAQLTEKIETDRPDQTENVYITPKKWFQFEMGLQMENESDGTKQFLHPTLLSKYGISNRIELRLITEWISDEGPLIIPDGNKITTGFLPIEIGAKIALFEQKGIIPKTSLIFHTTIPKLASEEFQQKLWGPNFRFTMMNEVSEKTKIGYNIGAIWDGSTDIPVWLYTLTAGTELSEKWGGFIEVFGFVANGQSAEHSIDGGLTFQINPNVQLDLAGGFGLTNVTPKSFISLGFSIRFH